MHILEDVIVANIQEYLKTVNFCWFFKSHGGAYQKKGLPDIMGCYYGRFFGIEVKRPGEKATELQEWRLRRIRAAGGIGIVATSVEQVAQIIYNP